MTSRSGRCGVTAWRRRLLILGGTDEASLLARAAAAAFGARLDIVTALRGRPEGMLPAAGAVRIGAFGAAAELADYLRTGRFDFCVDATPPFAAEMSAQAAEAAAAAGLPRLRLLRPMWRRHARDRWIEVGDIAGAAGTLRLIGHRVYVTLPPADLAVFRAASAPRLLVRVCGGEPPASLPAGWVVLPPRSRLDLAEERLLLRRHAIDLLVTRAEGGAVAEAKIVAAREADIPVVMVRRPLPPPGESAGDAGAALAWLRRRLAALDEPSARPESPAP